jgi:cytochrome subunit of sulfide dehydrogenase
MAAAPTHWSTTSLSLNDVVLTSPCCFAPRAKESANRKYHGASLSMRQIIAVSIAAGSFIILADRSQAADRDGGAQLAAMCASCHRPDGGDRGIPTILGMGPEMLSRAMLAYRSSERPSHIMRAVALSLSDEEIATVARYLAALNK